MTRAETIFDARRRRAEAEILPDALAAYCGVVIRHLDAIHRDMLAEQAYLDVAYLDVALDSSLSMAGAMRQPSTRWVEVLDEIRHALLRAMQRAALNDSDDAAQAEVPQWCVRSILSVASFLQVTAGQLEDAADAVVGVHDLISLDMDAVDSTVDSAYQVSAMLLEHIDAGTWVDLVEQYRSGLAEPDADLLELAQTTDLEIWGVSSRRTELSTRYSLKIEATVPQWSRLTSALAAVASTSVAGIAAAAAFASAPILRKTVAEYLAVSRARPSWPPVGYSVVTDCVPRLIVEDLGLTDSRGAALGWFPELGLPSPVPREDLGSFIRSDCVGRDAIQIAENNYFSVRAQHDLWGADSRQGAALRRAKLLRKSVLLTADRCQDVGERDVDGLFNVFLMAAEIKHLAASRVPFDLDQPRSIELGEGSRELWNQICRPKTTYAQVLSKQRAARGRSIGEGVGHWESKVDEYILYLLVTSLVARPQCSIMVNHYDDLCNNSDSLKEQLRSEGIPGIFLLDPNGLVDYPEWTWQGPVSNLSVDDEQHQELPVKLCESSS